MLSLLGPSVVDVIGDTFTRTRSHTLSPCLPPSPALPFPASPSPLPSRLRLPPSPLPSRLPLPLHSPSLPLPPCTPPSYPRAFILPFLPLPRCRASTGRWTLGCRRSGRPPQDTGLWAAATAGAAGGAAAGAASPLLSQCPVPCGKERGSG